MNRPWMQLYTRDWLDSKELRRCDPVSRAVLCDLMCLAHEGEPYGFLRDSIGPISHEYLAQRCMVSLALLRKCLKELREAGWVIEHPDGLEVLMTSLPKKCVRPRKFRASEARRRVNVKAAGNISLSLRSLVFSRDGHTCVLCGSGERLSVDHKHPISKGGKSIEENLQTLCMPCNIRKGDQVG